MFEKETCRLTKKSKIAAIFFGFAMAGCLVGGLYLGGVFSCAPELADALEGMEIAVLCYFNVIQPLLYPLFELSLSLSFPLVHVCTFSRYPLPLSVHTFKSSPSTHLPILFISVVSKFAECDTYPRTLKIITWLYRNQYESYLAFIVYTPLRVPPSPLQSVHTF